MSFSIYGRSTWTESPSLEIRVVEDPAAESHVGTFDGRELNPVDGRPEFLDENFPQVGWLGTDKFFYDLYDGKGYHGEPLRLTAREITPSEEADPRLRNVYRVQASFSDGRESARVGMKGIGKIDAGDTTLWSITTQRFARLWNRWSPTFSDMGVDHEAVGRTARQSQKLVIS